MSVEYRAKKIVFTNGIFDVMHDGHRHLLREAKKCGNFLVVALDSDLCARRLKGECRPRDCWKLRRHNLYMLEDVVDLVLWFGDQDHLWQLVCNIMPDVYVKGAEYVNDSRIYSWIDDGFVKELKFVDMLPGYSTTILTGFDYMI